MKNTDASCNEELEDLLLMLLVADLDTCNL